MFCRSCGKNLSEKAKFCDNCGVKTEIGRFEAENSNVKMPNNNLKQCSLQSKRNNIFKYVGVAISVIPIVKVVIIIIYLILGKRKQIIPFVVAAGIGMALNLTWMLTAGDKIYNP